MRILRGAKKTGRGKQQTYLVELSNGSVQELSPSDICNICGMRRNTFYSRVRDEDIFDPAFFRNTRKKNGSIKKVAIEKQEKRSAFDEGTPADMLSEIKRREHRRKLAEEKHRSRESDYMKALRLAYSSGGMNRVCNGISADHFML